MVESVPVNGETTGENCALYAKPMRVNFSTAIEVRRVMVPFANKCRIPL